MIQNIPISYLTDLVSNALTEPDYIEADKAKEQGDRQINAHIINWISIDFQIYTVYAYTVNHHEFVFAFESSLLTWEDSLSESLELTVKYLNTDPAVHYILEDHHNHITREPFLVYTSNLNEENPIEIPHYSKQDISIKMYAIYNSLVKAHIAKAQLTEAIPFARKGYKMGLKIESYQIIGNLLYCLNELGLYAESIEIIEHYWDSIKKWDEVIYCNSISACVHAPKKNLDLATKIMTQCNLITMEDWKEKIKHMNFSFDDIYMIINSATYFALIEKRKTVEYLKLIFSHILLHPELIPANYDLFITLLQNIKENKDIALFQFENEFTYLESQLLSTHAQEKTK